MHIVVIVNNKMKVQPYFLIEIILILTSTVNSQYCVIKEVKSSKGIYQQQRYDYRARKYVGGKTEYPTLYKYLLCNSTKMVTGQQINVSGQDSYKYIRFENSTISVIPAGVFITLTSLTEAYLNFSQIEMVEPGAFNGMVKLEELHLEDNNIEEIARGILNSLTRLKRLDVSRNNLSRIEDNSFHGLLVLEELRLSSNRLSNVTAFTFSSLNHLNYLDLSYNLLYAIEENSFLAVYNLNELIINNNNLTYFPNVQNLTKLQFLNLDNNSKIQEIDFSVVPSIKKFNIAKNELKHVKNWRNLKNIDSVDLRRNEISEIKPIGNGIIYFYMGWNNLKILNSSLFRNSTDLIELDLSYNYISQIKTDTFQGLSKLIYLYLNNNELRSIPVGSFKDLTSLTYLHLSYNSLVDLEFGTLAGLARLKDFYLDHNNFAAIHENSFHVLKNLEILNLNNNSIKIINPTQILNHLNFLKSIDLDINDWTCNSLLSVINEFKRKNINVTIGKSFDVPNIDGIPCTNEMVNIQTKQSNTSKPMVPLDNNNNMERFLGNDFYNSSFYRYFDEDFKNSSFYSFFERDLPNQLQREFTNTSFYRFFNQDFLSSSFATYLEHNFRNNKINHVTTEDMYALNLVEVKESNRNFELFADKIIILLSLIIVIMIAMIVIVSSLFCWWYLKRTKPDLRFVTEANMELL